MGCRRRPAPHRCSIAFAAADAFGGSVFRPNPIEVDAVVECSLPALVAGFERKRLIRRGVPIKTDTYTVDGNFIWGATARIVGTLLERLRPLL